ncbi:hypothetical protein THRCLA_23409 [Thraustotheca clavata]|uniref:Transmembrane protein n=1 Tax=Thraustotheca clavata TaxID=74557 RepID=A0A1V9Y679_9STRA|nr:hypothetical protein THRCLA_23409 [Thraustotheca clavata]
MLRRPTSVQHSGSSSIWDKEASEFWKDMKVDEKKTKVSSYKGRLVLGIGMLFLLAVGGFYFMSKPSVEETKEDFEQAVRTNCSIHAVQSRWHADICNQICPENEFNEPCTNGCLYGTMTITKAVCANHPLTAVDSSNCPYKVDCQEACVEYANVRPIPAKRNACEGGCNSVIPSSCKRAMEIIDSFTQR